MSNSAEAHALYDLNTRIEEARRKAATPGYDTYIDPEQVDLEAWNHIGDPLAEALLAEMRERKLMRGDHFDTARELQRKGVPAAEAFFADVEHVPAWADFEAMRPGAAMARRNPVGMVMGLHGALAFTYIDPATARVMASTGRLARNGSDFRRRFWETALAFVGTMDIDGMMPGGARWEKWVRVRLLHTVIRTGIQRSGRWDLDSMPLSQTATAAATHPFGAYRAEIIKAFGGHVTQKEKDSFSLAWRWVSRIEGANTELLGTTHAEEFRLAERQHEFLYAPDDNARLVTQRMIDGLNSMKFFPLTRRLHEAIVRRLFAPDMMPTLPGRRVADDFGLQDSAFAGRLLSGGMTALNGLGQLARLPGIKQMANRYGQRLFDEAVDRGLDRRQATYRATPVAGDTG